MREMLWPVEAGYLADEVNAFLQGQSGQLDAVFVAVEADHSLVGFIELRVRNSAEGSEQIAVPFVEGWFVRTDYRGRDVGKLLMQEAERWARLRGFRELGSDADLENLASHRAHAALGFEETERLVCFLKKLE